MQTPASKPVDSQTLNQRLRALYSSQLPEIQRLITNNSPTIEHIHGPFMMHVYPEYVQAPKKLLFVGMETYGWAPFRTDEAAEETYRRLTEAYTNFTEQEHAQYAGRKSPYWRFMEMLSQAYGVENFLKATLRTNLSKIDVNKGRPSGKLYDNTMQAFLALLCQEIEVIQPDMVIILTTDPNYCWHLNEQFGFWKDGNGRRSEIIAKRLFRLESPKLPVPTYQMCHPNRLRFLRGGFKNNADEIIQEIVLEMS
ncbi:hypothetical protein [Tellurirhabdus bombi]|uniref:hypothetical protein n=1 Tax=Tellurirhabdus bombi TaxID=2907205 RepID=UPI001F3F9CDE|nr:hypothetical protein [Tellurirhabdus bombi]